MYKFIISFEAEEDIIRIFEYEFNKFGINQAEVYYEKLYKCFDKIASNPFMFPEVVKYNIVVRYYVCGVHTIYYKITAAQVEIITIIGRQNY